MVIARSCDKIIIHLRSGNYGELYRRLSRASLLKDFGGPLYFRLFKIIVLSSCQLARLACIDGFGLQLIPTITQSDRFDREMTSDVVYPLKLFNSMFSNNDVLLWLCPLWFAACSRLNQMVLAFFVTSHLLRYHQFNQELCSLIFETKSEKQVSIRSVERKSRLTC